MASVAFKKILTAVNHTANANSDGLSVEQRQKDFIVWVRTENAVATTNTDVILQHSADETTWTNLATVPQIVDNGEAIAIVTTAVLPHVRANVTIGGGGSDADVTVRLYYDKD